MSLLQYGGYNKSLDDKSLQYRVLRPLSQEISHTVILQYNTLIDEPHLRMIKGKMTQ